MSVTPSGSTSRRRRRKRRRLTARSLRRFARATGSLATSLATAAGIGWMLSMIGCVDTSWHRFVIDEYDWTLPQNRYAAADGRAVGGVDGVALPPPKTLGDLRADLAGRRRAKAVVLYVNALGGIDGDGRVALLSADGDAAGPDAFAAEGRFGFAAVEDLFGLLLDPDVLPAETEKIVLLDLGGDDFRPDAGMLEFDVSADVREAVGAAAAAGGRLSVLLSCAPGEVSWGGDALGGGRTAFAHFIAAAFDADRGADASGDRVVTFGELTEYVAARVDDWVVQSRDPAGQHPYVIAVDETAVATVRIGLTRDTRAVTAEDSPDSSTDEAPIATTAAEAFAALGEGRRAVAEFETAEDDSDRGRPIAPSLRSAVRFGMDRVQDLYRAGRYDDVAERVNRIFEDLGTAARFAAGAELGEHPFARATIADDDSSPRAGAERPAHEQLEVLLAARDERLGRREERLPDRGVTRLVGLRTAIDRVAYAPVETRPWVAATLGEIDRERRRAEDAFAAGDSAGFERSRARAARLADEAERTVAAVDRAHRLLTAASRDFAALLRWAAERPPTFEPDRERRWSDAACGRLVAAYRERLTGPEGTGRPPVAAAGRAAAGIAEDDVTGIAFAAIEAVDEILGLRRAVSRDAVMRFADATDDGRERAVVDLRDRTDRLARRIRETEEFLDGWSRRTLERAGGQAQATAWRDLDHLAACPGAPVAARLDAVDRLGQVDRLLQDRTLDRPERNGTPRPVRPPPDRTLWRAACVIHALELTAGETAAAVLWPEWARVAAAASDDARRDATRRLGKLIATTRRAAAAAVVAAATAGPETDIAELLARESVAASLGGIEAERLKTVEIGRQVGRLADADAALTAAARHTDDFYAADSAGEPHWYATTSRRLLDAAGEMLDRLGRPDGPLARYDEVERTLDRRAEAALSIAGGPKVIDFGFASRATLRVTLASAGAVPEGTAAVWIDGVGGAPRGRPVGPEVSPEETEYELSRTAYSADGCEPATVTPRYFFRGHGAGDDAGVTVRTCPVGDSIVRRSPAPAEAAVVLDGVDRRNLLFVVDCSQSMDGPISEADDTVRHHAARRVLWNAIEGLAVSRGGGDDRQQVALVRFGANVFLSRAGTKFRRPEETLPAALRGTWGPNYDVDVFDWDGGDFVYHDRRRAALPFANLLGADGATRRGLRRLLIDEIGKTAEADRLFPFGNTPVGLATQVGVEIVDEAGGGVVVVVTDGASTEGNAFPKRLEAIGERLDGADEEIEVVVAGFAVSEEAEEKLSAFANHDRIAFVPAPEAAALARQLESLEPRPYTVEVGDRSRKVGVRPRERRLGEVIDGLEPGEVEVAFGDGAPATAVIGGGMRAAFELARGTPTHVKYPEETRPSRRPRFFRSRQAAFDVVLSASGEPEARPPGRWPGPGVAAAEMVCQEFLIADGEGSVVVSLDDRASREAVRPPAEIDFELVPADEPDGPPSVSIATYPGQSLPTWRVASRPWPAESSARLRAWWKPTRTPVDAAFDLGPLLAAGSTTETLPSADGRQIPVRVEVATSGDAIELIFLPPDDLDASSRDELLEMLEHPRVELGKPGPGGRLTPLPAEVETRHLPRNGTKVTVRLDEARFIALGDLAVGFTSRRSLRAGAITSTNALTIPRPDDR